MLIAGAVCPHPPLLVTAALGPAAGCHKLGAVIAERAPRVALLAIGDASAWRGRLQCLTAPYGVTYLVASWEELGAF